MALEGVPASSQSDGRWRITNVDGDLDATSVAVLDAGEPITYGITAGGWDHQINQDTVEDKRLTLLQDLSRPGKVKETLNVTVVYSASPTSADAILQALSESQEETQFVVRRAVDNGDAHAVAQKADIITGVVGVRRPDAPVENGVDTAQYGVFITKPTRRNVSLVA